MAGATSEIEREKSNGSDGLGLNWAEGVAWMSSGSSRASWWRHREEKDDTSGSALSSSELSYSRSIDSVSSLYFSPKSNHLVSTTCDNQERERDRFSQFITKGFTSYCKNNGKDKVL